MSLFISPSLSLSLSLSLSPTPRLRGCTRIGKKQIKLIAAGVGVMIVIFMAMYFCGSITFSGCRGAGTDGTDGAIEGGSTVDGGTVSGGGDAVTAVTGDAGVFDKTAGTAGGAGGGSAPDKLDGFTKHSGRRLLRWR
jgi:hypothetical protein